MPDGAVPDGPGSARGLHVPERLEPSLHLSFPATAHAVGLVRSATAAWASTAGADADTVDAVRLAVTEACASVLERGAPATPGALQVEAAPIPGGFVVVVREGATTPAPRRSTALQGVRFRVIRELAHAVSVRRPTPGGFELRLAFRLPAVAAGH